MNTHVYIFLVFCFLIDLYFGVDGIHVLVNSPFLIEELLAKKGDPLTSAHTHIQSPTPTSTQIPTDQDVPQPHVALILDLYVGWIVFLYEYDI